MMKKMALVGMMALTMSLSFNATAFAGMNNSTSEIFDDELPSIDIPEVPTEVETVPETEPETEPETKAPETEPETETVPETVPETKTPTKESKEESKETTTAPETEAPSRDYTPETSGRVIRHHRNVVVCDNEPIPTTEAETKVIETTCMDEPETETETETETVPETEKIPVPQPRLPKTADMSTVMGGIVAALAVTGTALGVVANRKKKEQ